MWSLRIALPILVVLGACASATSRPAQTVDSRPPSEVEMTDFRAIVGVCEASDRLRALTERNYRAGRDNQHVFDLAVTLCELCVWPTASDRLREFHRNAIALARCSSRYAFALPDRSITDEDRNLLEGAILGVRAETTRLRTAFGDADSYRRESGDAVMQLLEDELRKRSR